MPRITSGDGVGLHYLDEGSGPVTVLVHGYGAPAAGWAPQQSALVAAGQRVLAFDRRSHGESDNPAYGQRMARHGADLAEFLDTLDVRDALLVGASMGANVIWAYIDLFGTGRVRGVVSVDQTPKMINTDDWVHGFYGLTPQNAGTFFDHGIPATGRGNPPYTEEVAALVAAAPGPGPETRPLLRDHAFQDWRDVVARADVPILFLAGRDSQFWPCEHAAAAADLSPKATATVIDDCGHVVTADQPGRLSEELVAFAR
ncbi:alpha/beta fold hydrolase [Planobispora siamensis]|uniref:Alpha/beta hydrolase n=1 Tax=Planobispora siamensis TaxID=936338 RepID=A0A8J3SNR8_9ACTN|nr:alpha/beta hydrolase [Planobispora siamensis]GIH97796.1 alpha/beta hydrolase [Planobispora siamensis]